MRDARCESQEPGRRWLRRLAAAATWPAPDQPEPGRLCHFAADPFRLMVPTRDARGVMSKPLEHGENTSRGRATLRRRRLPARPEIAPGSVAPTERRPPSPVRCRPMGHGSSNQRMNGSDRRRRDGARDEAAGMTDPMEREEIAQGAALGIDVPPGDTALTGRDRTRAPARDLLAPLQGALGQGGRSFPGRCPGLSPHAPAGLPPNWSPRTTRISRMEGFRAAFGSIRAHPRYPRSFLP